MFRPGTDPENVQMSDVLCDYCRSPWTEDLPLVEGHEGSVICGKCVRVAYMEVVLTGGGEKDLAGLKCRMCLEDRADPSWASPLDGTVRICLRCIEMAAGAMESDADTAWTKPTIET